MACIRALYMQDILLAIFDQMPCHKGTYADGMTYDEAKFYQSNRQAVSRSARVCKAFSDPALQSLWRTLNSMKPLLRLLTCFKRVEGEDYISDADSDEEDEQEFVWALQGDVCPLEWERFRQYAKHVRSLRYHCWDAIDPSVLSVLAYRQQGEPILPQLRKLDWQQLSGDDVTLFPLVSPSLRDISLRFCGGGEYGQKTRRECVVESILRHIATKVPAIESLSVHGINQASSLSVLAACHHLRRLHLHSAVPSMNASSFTCLAGMPNLSGLHLVIDHVGHMPVSLRTGFSRLESLSLQGGQQNILSFLHAVSPSLLRSISLTYRNIWGPDGRNILEHGSYLKAMTSLALCTKFTALRRLIVRCSPWVSQSWVSQSWVSQLFLKDAAFTFIDLIRPLFVMGRLEEIHLEFEMLAMRLPDTGFHELTSAWPRMKAFTLHCNIYRGGLPSMSALVPFAQRCPDLKTLALPSIGSGESDTILPEAFPATTHGLRELTFQDCR